MNIDFVAHPPLRGAPLEDDDNNVVSMEAAQAMDGYGLYKICVMRCGNRKKRELADIKFNTIIDHMMQI